MALVPFDPDALPLARLVELSRLTPKERLDQALMRGGYRRLGYTYDPYTVLGQLDVGLPQFRGHLDTFGHGPEREVHDGKNEAAVPA